MPHWIRFEHHGRTGFGTLIDGVIAVHEGDMLGENRPLGRTLPLRDVRVLPPTEPSKMIALWNNFHALAAKLKAAIPADPLYLLKALSCISASGDVVRRPASYAGKVVFEGEFGIVIGRRCKAATEEEAARCIFGYTCVNDLTAAEIIQKDPSFPQWVRAKSFDGFGAFGPVIATEVTPEALTVRTLVNGEERQNYPIADMIFSARQLVSRLSHDMTLLPGDIICCGTSLGVGSLKEPESVVEVTIDGIGTLSTVFVQ